MQNMPNFGSMIDMDFIQIPFTHDSTCELIHKKCYIKEVYHNDMKYHMMSIKYIN